MYGRNLIFLHDGREIRYAKEVEELAQHPEKTIVIDVDYAEFPDQ